MKWLRNKFSLVEVLVALIILGVAGTILGQAMISSLNLNRNARNVSLATLLAREKIEGAVAAAGFSDTSRHGRGTGAFAEFEWYRDIEPMSTDTSGLRRVHVRVSWKTGKAQTREVTLATVVRAESDRDNN